MKRYRTSSARIQELIDWVKKRVCDMTEEGMSGKSADEPSGLEDRRLEHVQHVSSREFAASATR